MIKRIRTWLRTRRLYQAYPSLKAFDRQIDEARRRHHPVKHLEQAKAAVHRFGAAEPDPMTAMLTEALRLALEGDAELAAMGGGA